MKKIIIVGDTRDIATSVRSYLTSKHYSVSRISGSDRYQTANAVARAIARRAGGTVRDGKVVVVGNSYTYALAASAVAARKGWPLVFTRATGVPSSTRSTLAAIGASSALVVGGTMTVSNTAMSQLPSPIRIKGASSTAVPTALATWATTHYPADFSGERIYLASSSAWSNGLGLPAQAATRGGLILVTGTTLASPVRSYYRANSEVAVTTRAIASSGSIGGAALTTIKGIVGAP